VLLFQHSSRAVSRRDLRAFWIDLVAQLTPGRAATCLITTDAQLHSLNLRFRNKDAPTDVLSIASASGASGEIAISFDRAMEQAAGLGHTIDQELRILMLHGLLHLAGMDHETDGGEMARAEARWRKRLGLTPGLIERSR
jgi:probable rRNA maturation factor